MISSATWDEGGGAFFDSYGDTTVTALGPTESGHSTRDALLDLARQGIAILPALFGRTPQQTFQQTPPALLPAANGAGLNVNATPSGINLGGGIQFNTTTLLIGGLALALVLMKK